MNLSALKEQYDDSGFISPVKLLEPDQALHHRKLLENAEAQFGPMHYKTKVHSLFHSPYLLATLPQALDVVEALIGPNLLLYNATYIVKEPRSAAHVSWHQDFTYWGFDSDDQVSMWLALSPATQRSGCMQMIPGSHQSGHRDHEMSNDSSNVLLSGQTVAEVDESAAVWCPLAPGEASFHHGWTLHTSKPNQSDDRRIGLNVQFLATHVKQTKSTQDSAILVRGEDQYKHYQTDQLPAQEFSEKAIAYQAMLEARYIEIAGNGG